MTVTGADLSQWAAHRRAVVFTVSRRVPGIDPELAASRGLELLCVELMKHGELADPLAFWNNAAVDAAQRMAHEQALPGDGTAEADVITAPIRRALDFEVLNSAMERLSAGEQQLLWDHHVGSRPVAAIADEIGVLPYAAKRRLRRAENRLASNFAETHAGTADNAECRSTRASMHDFVRHRLLPHRRQQVEDHMVQCADCTRAFVDVRESYWMLRAASPVLLLGAVTAAETGATAAAGAGVAAASASVGWLTTLSTRVALTVRSALTDPVSLTATVAGGLFITTAVTTGVAGDAGAAPSFHETGTVSVSTPDGARTTARHTPPASPNEDPTNLPDPVAPTPTGLTPAEPTPPGLAKKDGAPPGQAKKTSEQEETTEPSTTVPPGQAKKDSTPPGLAKKDGLPPGQAKKDTPPGQAKKDTPPGQAKRDTPPGQAKRDTPPGQTEKDTPPGQAEKNTPPGQAKEDAGHGKREKAEGRLEEGRSGGCEGNESPHHLPWDAARDHGRGPGWFGQARSRRTSTS